MDYLKEVNRIISSSDSVAGLMVVNKEGIVEYYKPCSNFGLDEIEFGKNVRGKYLLDVYKEITTDNSTVMKTLKTGQVTIGQQQTLTTDQFQLTISSTTYPILDQDGSIQGAIDVARLLDHKKIGSNENVNPHLSILDDIVTRNEEMVRLKRIVQEVAKNNSPTMICGETGTGKELVAEALHMLSNRKNKPFISQNCAAIPANLLESLFFGTEKGGFTGAESRKGLFELADGGTLFLDEVNSMDVSMQAKLLKVLEEQKVRRVGGKEDIRFDVRIVSASNENPEMLASQGKLRSDFYYRISVVKLLLPPLRERPEDILLLTEHFIKVYNQKMNKHIKGLSQMTLHLFTEWKWPGNIRELKNTIESAFNMEDGDFITLDSVQDLLQKIEEDGAVARNTQNTVPVNSTKSDDIIFSPEAIKKLLATNGVNLKQMMEDYETFILSEALKQDRKLAKVAARLSISPQKLQYRMEKLNLK
ncbi:sigma-54 interaction domain-containing protein [Emergencia sp.]|uniref:sigma-54 interaction domain-containing protein n=1 Tax=Emergencia sp. TaxID=1926557 RepID=UPI003AEF9E96